MEIDDDMIVLVVVDDDEEETSRKEPPYSSEEKIEVDDILNTVLKHGQFIAVKQEPEDDYSGVYNLNDEITQAIKAEPLKEEPIDDTQIEEDDDDYIPDDDDDDEELLESDDLDVVPKRTKRGQMLKPWQQKSFIADLKREYEELRDDKKLLIYTLEKIMCTVKAPPPPRDFCIINGIQFECVQCGFLADTMPAAARHYQEKHGERYLVCYACGVDFRSTTNLYKHEKRCVSPDADIVLRARAAFLGRKGRGRPYLSSNKFPVSKDKRAKFPCRLCSAVFITKSNLESHENLHRGERPFRCHVCPCAYTSHSALSRHAKKHTDALFICDHCSREFKVRAALVSHLDTHRPIRKHGCDECNRRFAQKSALILHVNRVHRKLPPPCACQLCPKRYPRMSLLKHHMKRAHGMSIITRKMFLKSLPTMTELDIKESKVIHKHEDDADYYHFMKAKQEIDINFEEEFAEDSHFTSNEADENELESKDFIKYVTQSDEDFGPNVIVIENGEVVHTNGESDN